MPSLSPPLAVKALFLSLLLIGLVAGVSVAEDYEVSAELAEEIRQNTTPMPFPDITKGVITDEPFELQFKYDLEDRPPLPEWVLYRKDEKPEGQSPEKGKGPTRITDTETYPYSAAVHIYMKFGDHYSGCSGAFAINDYTILTAGHCLFNQDSGSYAEEVYVMPGQDGGDTPFGAKSAYNWATSRAWAQWGDYTQDWGVILVEPFSGNPGTLDTYYDSDDNWYFTHELDTAGYPGASPYNGEEMWWDRAYIDEMNWGMLRPDYHFGTGDYTCIPGQSGSSIYYDNGAGKYSIVAVLTLASCHGPVLDAGMVDFLNTFDCDGCWISNTCYADGEVHSSNQCKKCNVNKSMHDWSNNDGQTCDDGVWCNGADSCSESACGGHEGDPCGSGETCDEETDSCTESIGDDDDDDDVDDFSSYCQDLLGLAYDSCDLKILVDSVALSPQDAYDLCEAGQGPWDCMNECAEHDDVGGCSDFASCLKLRCDVKTTSGGGGGNDDDDGGSGGCSCYAWFNG